eukprot:Nk52_evm8s321 gene=Nk52_evmTU8s321
MFGVICLLKVRSNIPFSDFTETLQVCVLEADNGPVFEIELRYCYTRLGAFKDGVVCFLYKTGFMFAKEFLLYDCECGMKSKGTGRPNQPIEDEFPPLTILDPIIAAAERLNFPKGLQGISSDFKAPVKKHKEEQHQCNLPGNLFCQFVGLRDSGETTFWDLRRQLLRQLLKMNRRKKMSWKKISQPTRSSDSGDSGDSGKSLELSLDISDEVWNEKLNEYNPKEAAVFAEKIKEAEASKKKRGNKNNSEAEATQKQ